MSNLQTSQVTEEHDYGTSAPREFRFKMDGVRYLLREAKGDAVIQYLDSIQRVLRVRDRTATNDGAAKFQPALIAQCLFQVQEDGNLLAMTANFVRGLAGHIQQDLFERLEKMSGLARKTEETDDRIAKLEERIEELLRDKQFHVESNGHAESGNVLSPPQTGA